MTLEKSIYKVAMFYRRASSLNELERLRRLMDLNPEDLGVLLDYNKAALRQNINPLTEINERYDIDLTLSDSEWSFYNKLIDNVRWLAGLSAPNLEGVFLYNNRVGSLKGLNLFTARKLKNLVLDNNQIRVIDIDTLPFPNLGFLSLNGNQVEDVRNMASWRLPNLLTLSLVNNSISSINLNLPDLRTLNLENNLIKDLTWLENCNLPNLRELNVFNNQLTSLEGLEACNSRELTTVKLTGNRIRKINVHGFRYIFPNINFVL